MKVKELMASQVETLGRNDTLSFAEDLMKMKRFRHLPVLEDELLVGIVSQRDLFRAALSSAMGFGTKAQGEYLKTVLVKEVMTDEVVTIRPDDDITKAAKKMLREKIGCLPVVNGDKLVGLISESDIVRLAAES
ncbi:MAG: CBS domain-containing protein [Nitrospinaceae bacterium]|jgi:CBS domain-containing protein|nr:CBS domain-containing protein [Nitrospinaceae bacterium]MBT3821064.1 CBS domain-containing protein [Nitrospinaceae bacterium]MBT4094221.1 CBS domain-containing protein [Nitrospinaceae bacterium]MBT4431095.1 CBS domain-containing protein [Nitrospinaceae bacterium]MBT5366835.1 CBS domain-containing protein [Nitrospinaceae bacterium]